MPDTGRRTSRQASQSPAVTEPRADPSGEASLADCLDDTVDVVPDPVLRDRGRVEVEHSVRGPRVAVPGLADAPGVQHDALLVDLVVLDVGVAHHEDVLLAEEAETLLHGEVIEDEALSSITVEEGIGVIRVTGGDLTSQRDAVKQVIDPLAEAHIYVHDVITSATSVSVFVPWKDRELALEHVQEAF